MPASRCQTAFGLPRSDYQTLAPQGVEAYQNERRIHKSEYLAAPTWRPWTDNHPRSRLDLHRRRVGTTRSKFPFSGPAPGPSNNLRLRIAAWRCSKIDLALERLATKQRNAVLLCAFLNHDFASAAKVLFTSARRVEKRVGRG